MPIYEVQAPDGQIYDIEGPANADPKRLIDTLRRHLSSVKPAPAPSTERTALEAVTDVPASVLKGIGSMAQLPGQVYGLATGDFDTAAMRGPKKLQEYAESLKSKGLQTREALQSAAISEAAKNGIASEFLTAVTSTFKDPALISSFIAETVPQLLPALLTGGAYSALSTGARQVAKYGTKEAAEAAAAKGAARVAIGTGATQQGASVGTDTYTEALALAEKQYPNMPLEERQALALSKARATALQSGAISVGAQFLPGGSAIERRMAGLPGEGRIRSALGESASEIVEEGGGKFASNVNLQQIDPTRSLTEGVGQAAGMGAIGGGVLGGAIGRGAPAAPLQPGQNQGENLEQTATRLQQEILNAQKAITNLRQSTLPEEPADQISRANNELVALAANSQPLAIANQIQTEQAAAQAEGEQNAARFVAPTGGGSPAMAVEPTAGAAETIDGEIDRGGVVPTGPDVGVSVSGEGTAPAAVAPSYAPLLELPDVVTTFKTERGSTYAQHSDNSTTRNRSGINHLDPTTGLQLRSVKTIFLAPQDVNAIGGIFQNTEIATELVPVIKDNKPTGQVELKLTEDYGPRKAGTVLYTAPYDTAPSVGLSPVEVYSGSSPIGSAGSGVHFGNAITEVMPVAPTIKTPDVDTLATTDSAAQKPTIEVPSPGTTTSVAPILEAPTVTAPDVGRQTVTQPAPAALADVPPVETPAAATTTTEAPAVEEQKPAKVVTALNPEAQTLLEKVDQAIEVADTPQAPKGHTFNYEGRTFRIPGTPAALLKFKSTTLAKEFPESFQDAQAPAAPPVAPPAAPTAVQPTPEIKNIITGMIDDGDVESAISYADVHNVNIEDAFKGDTARLSEIQSYRQTKESLRQKPEGAQPAQGTVEAPKETLAELEARKAENTKQIEAAIAEKKKQLTQVLKAILTRMGLKDVSVKLIEDINSAEEGSYADRLMRIAVDADNPLRVLRHETIHALKELGFFTDSQWKSLTDQANKVWIDKYLKNVNVKYNGKVMSRYDAYMERENGNMEIIIEEAIADAFGDFSVKAPPGMLAAITARMKMLFQGMKSALNGTGFYTSEQIADQIFTKTAKGKLKAPRGMAPQAAEPPEARLSLRAPKTKAFKDWFGDSKVVDEKGEPLVVYHGTSADFDSFEDTEGRSGFYFTSDKKFANSFAEGEGANVVPVYLSIKKPADLRRGVPKSVYNDLKNKNYSRIIELTESDPKEIWNFFDGDNELADALKSAGYDGARLSEPAGRQEVFSWMAFKPTQIKSAIGNVGTYSKTNPDIRYRLRDKLGMYSELENKIETGSNKAPAASWKAYINGLTQKGVKPDEIEWSGVKDWLDLQKGTVTKDELLTYLKEGGVKVDEVVLDDSTPQEDETDFDTGRYLEPGSKYGTYTLPGGENYREVLLTLPSKKQPKQELKNWRAERFSEETGADYDGWNVRADMPNGQIFRSEIGTETANNEQEAIAQAKEEAASHPMTDVGPSVNYKSSHWDQPNVLAHIRLNDRTDADGNKVLFVEELQSDFGQEGKKKGFAGTIEAALNANQMTRDEFDSMPVEDQQFAIQETKRMGLPPVAPFVTKTEGWLNLALKRIMVMAAEGGYDKVAFVNGEQSADRYDLSKQIERIDVTPDTARTGELFYNLDFTTNDGRDFNRDGLTAFEINEYVGKEMAQKIIDAATTPGKRVRFNGLDLKVGGEGMKTFYDTIVPNAVKKLLPKVGGGQMKTVEMSYDPNPELDQWVAEDGESDGSKAAVERYKQPGFDVTPAMQDKVKTTGLPRFSLRNKTVNLNGRDIPVVLHALDKKRGDVLVPVKTKAFDDAWEASDKYKSFYIGAKGTGNAIKDRYERFAKFSVTAKNIEASSVSVDEDGNVGFGDGRHRWSFMRDQGVPVIPVAMSPESLKNAEKFGYVAKSGDKTKFSLRSTLPQSTQASINRITTAREEKGFIGRMMEAIAPKSAAHFRQQYLNRYNQLGRYDKMLADQLGVPGLLADASAEAAALMSDNGAGLTASALGVHDRVGGIPVFRNGVTIISNVNGTVAGPMKIFAKLTELGKGDPYIYQSYQLWAGAKRASRFTANGLDTPYTQADLQEAKNLEAMYPEFVEIQKDWIKYNNGLVQYMLDTGIISKENAKKFVEHSDYIPFYRQLDGEETIGPKIFQSISGVKAPRKAKGSEAPLADFMETVVRNTQSVIQAGLKNTAAKQAVSVAMQLGPNFIEPLNYASSLPSDVMVLENGLKKYYRSSDPLWIESLKALNAADLPFNALISGPANLLRTMVTKDPGFMLANMMRDSLAAHVTSGIKMTPIVDTIKNFTAAIAGQSPEFKTLLNAGLLGGYEFSQNIEYSGKVLEKELRKKTGTTTTTEKVLSPFTGLWSALEKGTTASDAATRIEVYKKTLAETGNEAEALFRAMEVMNFNRKGNSPVIRVITAAIPFLNARIQGLDVLYRAAFGQLNSQDAAKVQRLFFIRGAQMMALSCMYWALTHDDDEYKKQESETRDNYWLLPSLGIKIPIPFEIGILFKVIPERILAYSFGDDTGQDFMKSMARQLSSTLAVNPIPQAALPVVEAVTNHSFFTQRPIVGQGMEGVAPGYQVGPGTTNIAADIGKALNISPMKLDHMIKGYTGTIGMYLMDVVDSVYSMNSDIDKPSKRIDQLPVLKRFLIDPEARGTVTAFYEMKNAADQVVRTENLLERTFKFDARADYLQENGKMLVAEEYVKTLEKTMKQFREMKLMIRSSNMPSDDKRDALSQITAAENRLTSNIQAMKKALQ